MGDAKRRKAAADPGYGQPVPYNFELFWANTHDPIAEIPMAIRRESTLKQQIQRAGSLAGCIMGYLMDPTYRQHVKILSEGLGQEVLPGLVELAIDIGSKPFWARLRCPDGQLHHFASGHGLFPADEPLESEDFTEFYSEDVQHHVLR